MGRKLILLSITVLLLINPVYAGITISGGTVTADPTGQGSTTTLDPEPELETLGDKIVKLASYGLWVATAFALIGFAYAAMRLAMSTGNPHKKEEAQRGMLICFICLVLLGSVNLILGMAMGAFN